MFYLIKMNACCLGKSLGWKKKKKFTLKLLAKMSSETKKKKRGQIKKPGDIFCYWKCSKCKENQNLQKFDKWDERLWK